jgi:hypothetical protein
MFSLRGRTALLTGAGSGIGAAVAKAMARVLNIVVNNVGVIAPAMFRSMTADQFGLVLDVHVGGTFTVNAVAPLAATPMTENIRGNEKLAALTLARIPSAAGPNRTRSRAPSSTSASTRPGTSSTASRSWSAAASSGTCACQTS